MSSRRGQSIFEAAVFISVAVIALVVIQTYVRRSLQDRITDSARWQPQTTGGVPVVMQYEPYYLAAPNPSVAVSQSNTHVTTATRYSVTPTSVTGGMTTTTERERGAFEDEYPPRP